jgi:hypothetical protein
VELVGRLDGRAVHAEEAPMWGWLPGRKRCKQRPDRLESYTDRARLVVVLAQREVRRLRHERLGTEHVLLGLLAEGTGIASRALAAVGVSLATARAKLEELVGRGQGAASGYLQLDPRAKQVLFAGARLRPCGLATTTSATSTCCCACSARAIPQPSRS